MTTQLTIGKLRGLQQCATTQNAVAVLALDHRQGLRKALKPNAPDTVTDAEMSAFKQQLTAALAPAARTTAGAAPWRWRRRALRPTLVQKPLQGGGMHTPPQAEPAHLQWLQAGGACGPRHKPRMKVGI